MNVATTPAKLHDCRDAFVAVLERLAAERNPLYEEIADFTVRTDEQSARSVANQIVEQLGF